MFGFTLAHFVVVIPYILAFFTMFNVGMVDDGAELTEGVAHVTPIIYNTLVIVGFLLGAASWWVALTSLINLFRRGFRPRHMLTINRVAGIIICALGIITLISVLIK